MQRFYLHTFVGFAAWHILSLTLHFFSSSPWGGPLVLDPDRMLPDAIFIELGLLIVFALSFGGIERLCFRRRNPAAYRIGVLGFFVAYAVFSQLDREAVRWLGQHLTLSFLTNYAGAANDELAWRMFGDDLLWTLVAGVLIFTTVVPAIIAWRKSARSVPPIGWRPLVAAIVIGSLFLTAHRWFRPSEKRWNRVRPASISIVHDVYREVRQLDRPNHPEQALHDLTRILLNDDIELTKAPDTTPAPTYPLWRQNNLGELSADAFKELPLKDRPNIVFIIFETWRGWNNGLTPSTAYENSNPQLHSILTEHATRFPYTHSVGFPSVEGLVGLHLGIWSHPFKIFTTDYLHIQSRAFPEILKDFGYDTYALMGADPSFSNFTPWLHRWYDHHEFQRDISTDEAVVDHFIKQYQERQDDRPHLMTMWTATTHPPYYLPDTEEVEPAEDIEGRYVQSLRYSDKHIARLLRYLQDQPEWDRTIVVLVGDHAQPTPDQWRFMDEVGGLSAGHTWTSLAILGGWEGLPDPGQWDFDVSHVDIAPTLLSMLNINAPNHFVGDNLIDEIAHQTSPQHTENRRVIASLRYGDVAFQRDSSRMVFSLKKSTPLRFEFDRSNALQYGQLDREALQIEPLPNTFPVDRWRDAIRAYGALLDDDRLMPPPQSDAR